MYEEFYNLKEKPFNLNPSPRFLYLSDTHKEALSLLTYGVMERKGFILLTGEVGTGKTTVIQALIASLEKNIQYIFISNPLMSVNDFLDYIAFNTFHKKIHFRSKADFLIEFEEYLKKCLQHQKTFVLIIDEAQTLSYELLEEIRLLSNLESADEKLINIFLIGQPELNDKLSKPRCRPILQRINNRYHIKPLDLDGTRTYISTRLKVAGINKPEDSYESQTYISTRLRGAGINRPEDIFPEKTVKALHEYSGGFPRMINVLADNALLLGYSKEKKRITPDMIRECYEDINIKSSSSKHEEKPGIPEIPVQEQLEKRSAGRYLKRSLFFLFLLLLILLLLGLFQIDHGYLKQIKQSAQNAPILPEVSSINKIPGPEKTEPDTSGTVTTSPVEEKTTLPPQKEQPVLEDAKQEQVEKPAPPPEIVKQPFQRVIVKRGDILTRLSLNIYGRSDDEILAMIKRHNPDLVDINQISTGQEILFPPLPTPNGDGPYTVQIGSFRDFKDAQERFQELIRMGSEAYILPISGREQAFRVTMGSFQSRPEADRFAHELLKKRTSENVEVIKVDLN